MSYGDKETMGSMGLSMIDSSLGSKYNFLFLVQANVDEKLSLSLDKFRAKWVICIASLLCSRIETGPVILV